MQTSFDQLAQMKTAPIASLPFTAFSDHRGRLSFRLVGWRLTINLPIWLSREKDDDSMDRRRKKAIDNYANRRVQWP